MLFTALAQELCDSQAEGGFQAQDPAGMLAAGRSEYSLHVVVIRKKVMHFFGRTFSKPFVDQKYESRVILARLVFKTKSIFFPIY